MNKGEFIRRVASILRENDMKKPVTVKKTVFHISDDNGNAADFTIKQNDKQVIYTVDDVACIVEACLVAVEDALKNGERVTIKGFGSLGLRKRAPRKIKQVGTDTWCDVDGRLVPNFHFGNALRMAARVFEMSQKDIENAPSLPDPIYDENDDADD